MKRREATADPVQQRIVPSPPNSYVVYPEQMLKKSMPRRSKKRAAAVPAMEGTTRPQHMMSNKLLETNM